jgi:ATP-dependent DNA helicase RecG
MLSLINKIGAERLENFSTDDFLVINCLFNERKLSANLHKRTKRLIDMGIIEHVSRNKFALARGLYKAAGKIGSRTRFIGLDKRTNKELLLKHIRENGLNGAPLAELQQVLPGHSRRQIQALLGELRKEGSICSKGRTRGSKWHIKGCK